MLGKLIRDNKGDTIVEVLIAMAVAAAVLGSSYAVVNRTMANTRQAQEHSEALEIAKKQVEGIVALAAKNGTADLIDGNPKFNCIDKATGELVGQPLITSRDAAVERYQSGCIVGVNVQYQVAFEYVTAGLTAQQQYFKVYVTWPSVTGRGYDKVDLTYRAYGS